MLVWGLSAYTHATDMGRVFSLCEKINSGEELNHPEWQFGHPTLKSLPRHLQKTQTGTVTEQEKVPENGDCP